MKVLSIGRISYDRTMVLDSFIKENGKMIYTNKSECTGGTVSNVSFLLSRWGEQAYIAGKIGNDQYSRRVRKDFLLNNIDSKYLFQDDNINTSLTDIIVNRENGSKTYLRYLDQNNILDDFNLEDSPDIIFMDGLEYKMSDKLINMYPNALKIIDPDRDTSDIVNLCKKCNYIICSKEFAESVTSIDIDLDNKRSLASIYNKLNDMFDGNIIITLGSFGSLYRLNNQIKIMPSIKVKTIDSAGAGDIFRGAFIYSKIRNFDLEKALKFSSVAAALAVTREGEYLSIPSLEEMMEIYNEVK